MSHMVNMCSPQFIVVRKLSSVSWKSY